MLKASAGGGGIGMVRCEDEQALSQHFQSVKTRAKAYFGDDVFSLKSSLRMHVISKCRFSVTIMEMSFIYLNEIVLYNGVTKK